MVFAASQSLKLVISPTQPRIPFNIAINARKTRSIAATLAASEFVGYIQLTELKNASNAIHLNYEKSIIMATYMLCGFANFASIGIQIGGIGSLAPGQRKALSEFGLKALLGGTLASLLSATIAGMLIG